VRILITGAAGTGTTTLGRALSQDIGAAFLDADDYYWLPSDPPYQFKRPPDERFTQLQNSLSGVGSAVIAGSVMEWGRPIENSFSLVVFLFVPAAVRVERLRRRELERYGKASEEFLAWALQYDEGRLPGRTRARHEAWLSLRSCEVLRLEGDMTTSESLSRVKQALSNSSFERAGSNGGPRLTAAGTPGPAAQFDR